MAKVCLVSGLIERELYSAIALTSLSELRLIEQGYLLVVSWGENGTGSRGQDFLVPAIRRKGMDEKCSVFKGLIGKWRGRDKCTCARLFTVDKDKEGILGKWSESTEAGRCAWGWRMW